MTYLTTPAAAPLYDPEPDTAPPVTEAESGAVPNYLRVFALCPDAYDGWRRLAGTTRAGMDPGAVPDIDLRNRLDPDLRAALETPATHGAVQALERERSCQEKPSSA